VFDFFVRFIVRLDSYRERLFINNYKGNVRIKELTRLYVNLSFQSKVGLIDMRVLKVSLHLDTGCHLKQYSGDEQSMLEAKFSFSDLKHTVNIFNEVVAPDISDAFF
jgi:hypothetical protein